MLELKNKEKGSLCSTLSLILIQFFLLTSHSSLCCNQWFFSCLVSLPTFLLTLLLTSSSLKQSECLSFPFLCHTLVLRVSEGFFRQLLKEKTRGIFRVISVVHLKRVVPSVNHGNESSREDKTRRRLSNYFNIRRSQIEKRKERDHVRVLLRVCSSFFDNEKF